ncbi:hypothetical protein GCM10028804_03930 [Larkinella terrae]
MKIEINQAPVFSDFFIKKFSTGKYRIGRRVKMEILEYNFSLFGERTLQKRSGRPTIASFYGILGFK